MSTLRGAVPEDPHPHVDLVKITRPWTSSQWYNEMRLLGEGRKLLCPERQKKQVIVKKFWLHFSAIIRSTIRTATARGMWLRGKGWFGRVLH